MKLSADIPTKYSMHASMLPAISWPLQVLMEKPAFITFTLDIQYVCYKDTKMKSEKFHLTLRETELLLQVATRRAAFGPLRLDRNFKF